MMKRWYNKLTRAQLTGTHWGHIAFGVWVWHQKQSTPYPLKGHESCFHTHWHDTFLCGRSLQS